MTHRPALDVVRGAAVALVLAGHLGMAEAAGVGVTMFFVLSGFLITRLLRSEIEATGRVSLPAFYRRRSARLLPAVVVVAAVVGVAGIAAHDRELPVYAAASLTYITNWLVTAGLDMGPLRHTWSLAVEEQFYIVWPLACVLVVRLRRPGLVLALAATAALLWGGVAFSGSVEYRTDIRAGALLLGCALAFAGSVPRRVMLLALVPLAVLSVAWWSEALTGWAYGASALAAALVVAWAGASAWSGWRPAAYLGRISYGLYLWHLPLFALLGANALAVAVSVAVAAASFHLLEQPIRLRFSGRRVAVDREVEVAVARVGAPAPHHG